MSMNNVEEKLYTYLDSNDALSKVTELVEARLVDCGWRDQFRQACRKMLADNSEHLTMDALNAQVAPLARSMVSDTVKKEVIHEIEKVLLRESAKSESTASNSGAS